MKRLIVESPLKASERFSIEDNIRFARQVCRRAVLMGFAPYASHLFFTQPGILDDDKPEERKLGIDAGLAWSEGVEDVWICLREGEKVSSGMIYAYDRHRTRGAKLTFCLFSEEGDFLRYVPAHEVMP